MGRVVAIALVLSIFFNDAKSQTIPGPATTGGFHVYVTKLFACEAVVYPANIEEGSIFAYQLRELKKLKPTVYGPYPTRQAAYAALQQSGWICKPTQSGEMNCYAESGC